MEGGNFECLSVYQGYDLFAFNASCPHVKCELGTSIRNSVGHGNERTRITGKC